MKNKEYRFNKIGHLHEIFIDGDWKPLTGCTTIQSVLAKPFLAPWAVKEVVEYIKENAEKKKGKYLLDNELLKEAKKAYINKRNKGGDYGTKVHEEINKIIKYSIKTNNGYIRKVKSKEEAVNNFVDWALKNKAKLLETEKHIYSKELFIGGIIDFICEIEGKVWLGDIKTSKSGIHPENFAQVAGYHLMLQEMKLYPNVAGYLILNLKKNGKMLEKRSISNEDNKKFFLACLEIYRQLERLKNKTTNN